MPARAGDLVHGSGRARQIITDGVDEALLHLLSERRGLAVETRAAQHLLEDAAVADVLVLVPVAGGLDVEHVPHGVDVELRVEAGRIDESTVDVEHHEMHLRRTHPLDQRPHVRRFAEHQDADAKDFRREP